MPKPLIADLPYPSYENLSHDIRSGNIISFAYATQTGELTATLQYLYQSIQFSLTSKEDCDLLESIAIAEMKHLDILANTMLRLGVDPVYSQQPNSTVYYTSSSVSKSKTPQKMIMDSIQGEMIAISDYKKMLLLLQNEQVSAIIQRIVIDEELHLETLKKLLAAYDKKR